LTNSNNERISQVTAGKSSAFTGQFGAQFENGYDVSLYFCDFGG
jgi:hypothetical protein